MITVIGRLSGRRGQTQVTCRMGFSDRLNLQRISNRYSGDPRADQLGNFPCVGSSLHDNLIRRLEALSNECLDTLPCNGNATAMKLFSLLINKVAIGPSDNYLFELEAQPGGS